MARRWWWLAFALIVTCIILPYEVGVLIGLGGIAAVLAGSPFLGLWLLRKKTA
jgi:hypothetical protein